MKRRKRARRPLACTEIAGAFEHQAIEAFARRGRPSKTQAKAVPTRAVTPTPAAPWFAAASCMVAAAWYCRAVLGRQRAPKLIDTANDRSAH